MKIIYNTEFGTLPISINDFRIIFSFKNQKSAFVISCSIFDIRHSLFDIRFNRYLI